MLEKKTEQNEVNERIKGEEKNIMLNGWQFNWFEHSTSNQNAVQSLFVDDVLMMICNMYNVQNSFYILMLDADKTKGANVFMLSNYYPPLHQTSESNFNCSFSTYCTMHIRFQWKACIKCNGRKSWLNAVQFNSVWFFKTPHQPCSIGADCAWMLNIFV